MQNIHMTKKICIFNNYLKKEDILRSKKIKVKNGDQKLIFKVKKRVNTNTNQMS
jgi:hypothetical protein